MEQASGRDGSSRDQPRAVLSPSVLPVGEIASRPLPQVLMRVRLLCARRAAWLRHLWARESLQELAPMLGGSIGHGEVDDILADRDNPLAEAAWVAGEPSLAELREELERLGETPLPPPLAHLVHLFQLSTAEADLLQLVLALEIDPSLGRAYAYLQDHAGRAYATEELARRLFAHALEQPGTVAGGIFTAESPLGRWRLLEAREVAPTEPPALVLDPTIRHFLLGRQALDPELIGGARLVAPRPPLEGWPVAETAGFARELLAAGRRLRLTVAGPPGSGRKTFAAAVARELDLPLLALDSERFARLEGVAEPREAGEDWQRFFVAAQRQAFLDGTALAWSGAGALERRWPGLVVPFPLQFVIAEGRERPGPAAPVLLVAGDESDGYVEHRVELPPLSVEERRRLWHLHLPASASWEGTEVEELARRYRVPPGEIAAVGARGSASPRQAAEAVRAASRHRLGELAQRLECPFAREDLIVPPHVDAGLDDFLYEASVRNQLWEEASVARLFPEGRGLMALFSGPPGVGKTMAAQVAAAELGLDLYRIDLASVISKYIGETSKNLERVLSRARHMDAVLLFDEADTLFGRRTEVKDAHDRFANADTNYLLQAIESYPGVALLSTNRKGNVDPAFLRRLRYVLELPKPDAPLRERLWRRLVAELAGTARLSERDDNGRRVEENLLALAQTLDLTGAQIKHAVLAGLIAARREEAPLALTHLLRGVDRELAKEGRAVSERERSRLAVHDGGSRKGRPGRA